MKQAKKKTVTSVSLNLAVPLAGLFEEISDEFDDRSESDRLFGLLRKIPVFSCLLFIYICFQVFTVSVDAICCCFYNER